MTAIQIKENNHTHKTNSSKHPNSYMTVNSSQFRCCHQRTTYILHFV